MMIRRSWVQSLLGAIFDEFVFAPPCVKICQIIWQKRISRKTRKDIWVFPNKEIWRISVRLSDRSKVTQNKINFVKNFLQWGLNPWTADHHSNALPTELDRNLLGRCALYVLCTTSHVGLCSFLESIENDFIKALMIHTDNQIVT